MNNTSNRSPRFGIDYFNNWLSTPASSPDAEAERRLMQAVVQQGTYHAEGAIRAGAYSRDEWSLKHGDDRLVVTFQNFGGFRGPSAACTFRVLTATTNREAGCGKALFRGVYEGGEREVTHYCAGTIDKLKAAILPVEAAPAQVAAPPASVPAPTVA